ncbi:MAG: hypothetical protein E2O66_03065 [Deltaproteobacteria bacterium]|nr:hypothetical protein [Myxococcales bacterium]TDJ14476.1 MAG: hypothetical protein E2O66_03065 [Deltaproteobacteria bacterium]TDJ21639.1 MAG: hypothetical protein E2O69_01200 [Deltaproteobacteria bacterium]
MLLYSIALEFTMLFAFWLALAVWQRDRSSPGRITFIALCLSAICWCLGSILHARGLGSEWVADRIRILGMLGCGPLWLGVAGHAARNELARRVPWFPLILLAPCAGLYGLLYSDRWSGLFIATVPGGANQLGSLFWVFNVYIYAIVATGCGLMIHSALRNRGHGPWIRRLLVGCAPLAPMIGNVLFLMGDRGNDPELTPILLVITMIAVRGELISGTFFQVLPVSQHDLMQQLPIGVVLTDTAGVVIGVNPAAERRIGVIEAHAIGRNLESVVADSGPEVRLEISPILAGGREAGQLVLIDPPSKNSRS